ncbi:MAG: cytochrome c, partial [Rhodospirillaceae bacterium]
LFVLPWRILSFDEGPMAPDPKRSESWNRGAYLVNALTHCGECHTPRNFLGGFLDGKFLAGAADGPTGEPVPNITPDNATGIGEWSDGDYESLLGFGMLPDGDMVGGEMTEVYENTAKLTEADRRAIKEYLKSVP